uniref:Uncharacterized protein n=1 Tax=Anguilla anguilla TaxID=7936 RepID=A0A0E9PGN6_ANGAN
MLLGSTIIPFEKNKVLLLAPFYDLCFPTVVFSSSQ